MDKKTKMLMDYIEELMNNIGTLYEENEIIKEQLREQITTQFATQSLLVDKNIISYEELDERISVVLSELE